MPRGGRRYEGDAEIAGVLTVSVVIDDIDSNQWSAEMRPGSPVVSTGAEVGAPLDIVLQEGDLRGWHAQGIIEAGLDNREEPPDSKAIRRLAGTSAFRTPAV